MDDNDEFTGKNLPPFSPSYLLVIGKLSGEVMEFLKAFFFFYFAVYYIYFRTNKVNNLKTCLPPCIW